MEMKDILGLGKILPIDKLIDVINSSVGRLSKAYFDKKDIDTRVYEMKVLAQAKAEGLEVISKAVKSNASDTEILYNGDGISIKSLTDKNDRINESSNINKRVQDRLEFQEQKRQLNLERITTLAASNLKEEQFVSNEVLNEDWTTRFFNIAKDISNDEMQLLWAKILSKEIKTPRSFSLRTLELLRNLSKEEAEVFIRFAELSIYSSGMDFLLNFENEKFLTEKYKLTLKHRLLLEELGLISSNILNLNIPDFREDNSDNVFIFGDKFLQVQNSPPKEIEIILFTSIGSELIKLVENKSELDYIELLASKIRGYGIKMFYGDIIEKLGSNELIYKNLKDITENPIV